MVARTFALVDVWKHVHARLINADLEQSGRFSLTFSPAAKVALIAEDHNKQMTRAFLGHIGASKLKVNKRRICLYGSERSSRLNNATAN